VQVVFVDFMLSPCRVVGATAHSENHCIFCPSGEGGGEQNKTLTPI